MKKILLIICGVTIAAAIEAQIIHVPEDYPTIQQGINAAASGDTVLVAEGTYYENINFQGKMPLMVASMFLMDADTNHINNTIINGSQPVDPDLGSVVTLASGEDSTSVLCGFTITGGTGTYITVANNARFGGGVLFVSGGKLLNNHIEYNIITNDDLTAGGGVSAVGPLLPQPWIVLRGNRISHNKSISSYNQGNGGGIECWFNLVMVDNVIYDNEASGIYKGDGGGARISGNYGPIVLDVRNNQITHNKAKSISNITDVVISGGLDIFHDCSGIVSCNTIAYNEIEVASGKWCYGTGVLVQTIDATDFIFDNNIINDNSFTGGYCMGGGLLIYDATGIYQNNVVQNNHATQGGGVGFSTYNTDNMPVFINNTITGNEGMYGGGLWSATDAVVINSIIWNNTADEGASIFVEAGNLEVRYSDVQGAIIWPGEGNMNIGPPFYNDGYHLLGLPSLLNTGITIISINGVMYHCPEYDIDGDPRPFQNQPEIGVDEVNFISIGEMIPASSLAINVHPNPCTDILTVSTSNEEKMDEMIIYTNSGQEIMHQTLTAPTAQIDISHLLTGLYFLKVTCNNAVQVVKLVKE